MNIYHFRQNNSYGKWDVDSLVCRNVFIEAGSADEANDIARGIGVYFDGCDNGIDCNCYGDRWYPADEPESDIAETIAAIAKWSSSDDDGPLYRIFFKVGSVFTEELSEVLR